MSLVEDAAETDDAKPFAAGDDQPFETEPDPDEIMEMGEEHLMWLVKMPKFLLKRWAAVEKEGVHLATIRVYDEVDPVTKTNRIEVVLPEGSGDNEVDSPTPEPADGATDAEARIAKLTSELDSQLRKAKEFELSMVDLDVANQFVIAEKEKAPHSRARHTSRMGKVRHECNLQPIMDARYRRIIKERVRIANTSKRPIQRMEEHASTQSINRLASGVPTNAALPTWTPRAQKPQARKGEFERFARMPRNELYDALFERFKEKQDWTLRDLRARTQQPEAYLKEVLSEVASLHRTGEKVGLWSLKETYLSASTHADVKAEDRGVDVDGVDDDMDDEDDEDDDMEEIS